MSFLKFKKQVVLLLQVLPIIAEEKSFALHGGTGINLFQNNMPRLSVDIDLTYLEISDRDSSIQHINKKLFLIKERLVKSVPRIIVNQDIQGSKLLISNQEAIVKVEVNQIKRGCFASSRLMTLCPKAQAEFMSFSEIQVVELGHLYGGKICAALDRQHPRDLFDVRSMLLNEGLTQPIIKGFIFYLISSNRPIVEMLKPNLQDQKSVFQSQFIGMTQEEFTYNDFEKTRLKLISEILKSLSYEDKEFLLSIEEGSPHWDIYDFHRFPAVQWKLQNINHFRRVNTEKHSIYIDSLKEILGL